MTDERTPLMSGSTAANNNEANLLKFRKAIGINVESHTDDLESARKGATGIYKEIIGIQRWRSRQYRIVEILYYIVLGAQICIGATLTALGPQSQLHAKAITILGVVNTSIAGILAMLKGQGLPDRLRKDEYEMKKVQDYIEESETRLMYAEDNFTDEELDDVLQTVFAKYNAARDTAEMNRPDRYAHQGEADVVRRVQSAKALKTNKSVIENGKGNGNGNGNGNGKGKDAIQYEIS